MPQRKIYFYRAHLGYKDDGSSIGFDATEAFQEVNNLSFSDVNNWRYMDVGEGDMAYCVVAQLETPQRVCMVRSRRTHLPPVERGGTLAELGIPDDAGLAEQSFLVFFPRSIVGCVYNRFSPRVSVMRRYLREKCSDRQRNVDFAPLLRQDVIAQLEQMGQIRLVELRVMRTYRSQVAEASQSFSRALDLMDELGEAGQVAITLQPEPYKRGWLSSQVHEFIRTLARQPELREGVTAFRIKGKNSITGRLDHIDVLKDQFVQHRDIAFDDERSAALLAQSAYQTIEEVYDEMQEELESASVAL